MKKVILYEKKLKSPVKNLKNKNQGSRLNKIFFESLDSSKITGNKTSWKNFNIFLEKNETLLARLNL